MGLRNITDQMSQNEQKKRVTQEGDEDSFEHNAEK